MARELRLADATELYHRDDRRRRSACERRGRYVVSDAKTGRTVARFRTLEDAKQHLMALGYRYQVWSSTWGPQS